MARQSDGGIYRQTSYYRHVSPANLSFGPIGNLHITRIEPQEEKDEITIGALSLLIDLEQDIVATHCEHEDRREMFANIHAASRYNIQWLQHMLDTFDERFVARQNGTLSCQLCGWRMAVEREEDYGDVLCEICGGQNSMG